MEIFLAALLPVAILLFYIYRKDKSQPEPMGQLIKAFFYGILTIPIAVIFSGLLGSLGLYTENYTSILGGIMNAFFSAALPEESAKLILLWLLLRKNKYFDEKMDGIVYAVFISMGFASVENLLYLYDDAESFLSIGLVRGIFAVPGHFCYGILMGYYYSLAKFYNQSRTKNTILILLAPMVAHGIYDAILMVADIAPLTSGLLLPLFFLFCHKMWKYGSRRIEEHLQKDMIDL